MSSVSFRVFLELNAIGLLLQTLEVCMSHIIAAIDSPQQDIL